MMAGLIRTLRTLIGRGKDEPFIPTFIDEPGKGYRGPTPAKAVANAPAVVDPTVQVHAPVDGTVLALTQVPDPTIAETYFGAGLAVDAESGLIVAPVAGKLHLPFPTLHAFTITTETGIDVLVHIGVDTVHLPQGTFIAEVQDGDDVVVGQPIIRFDFERVCAQVQSLATCVLIQHISDHDVEVRPNAGSLGVFAGDDLFSLEVR